MKFMVLSVMVAAVAVVASGRLTLAVVAIDSLALGVVVRERLALGVVVRESLPSEEFQSGAADSHHGMN